MYASAEFQVKLLFHFLKNIAKLRIFQSTRAGTHVHISPFGAFKEWTIDRERLAAMSSVVYEEYIRAAFLPQHRWNSIFALEFANHHFASHWGVPGFAEGGTRKFPATCNLQFINLPFSMS
jgi:hypothetical protein